jgi:alpha-tubulin suppressor-like RCC1 family protein
MVLAPGWVTGSTWPAQTVVALNSAVVRSSALIEGDVAVLTSGTGFIHGNSELSILANAEIKGAVQADAIDMASEVHVIATAKDNTLSGGGTNDGVKTSPLALPLNVTIVATSNFSAGSTNLTVATGTTKTVSSSSYNTVTVPTGSRANPTTLRLNSGTYNIGTLTLGDFSRVECKGPCTIRVKNRVSAATYAYIGPGGGGNDQTYTEVKLFVEGTNGSSGANGTPAALAMAANSELKAFTFVPNGTMSLASNVSGVGKFIAKDIDIGANTELMTGTDAQRVLTDRFIVGPSWPNEVFTAFNSVEIQSGTTIDGDTAVIQNGTKFLSTSEAAIATGATLHGNLRADKVELKSGAQVTGSITYNTIVKSGTAGSLVTPLLLPIMDIHVPVFPWVTVAGRKTKVAGRVDITKDAGRYRDVVLSSGIATDRTKLFLSGGVYEMRNLTLGDYCSVICLTECELRIKQKLATGDESFIGPDDGLDPSALKIFVWGDTQNSPSKTPFAVSLGTDANVQALMFAGRGTFEAKSGSVLKGRFIARDILLGSSSSSEQAGITDTPPSIQTQPASVTLVSGQNATFSVAASGTDITFQWYRDGMVIPGATLGTYTESSVTLADDNASFTVVVSNAVGSISSDPAVLTVNVCDPLSYVPTPTSCGEGGCARAGALSCVSGFVVDTCVPGLPAADDALCDGVDNDCNGQIDEDYAPVTTTCGAGACAATGVTSCVHGAVQDSCSSSFPAPSDSTCDGRDDDCNGQVDEDYVPVVTTCGVGACLRHGVTSCSDGEIMDTCRAGSPGSSDDDCDGIDDDCDGEADQDYEPDTITCGAGACKATGETECVNGTIVKQCTPGNNAPNDATCDGVDDDCSGTADEDYVPVVSNCGVGACARTGMTSCVAGIVQLNCTPGAKLSTTDSTCNDVDDNCNGQKDEGYLATQTNCGVGACARTGQNVCTNGTVVNTCTPGTPAAKDAVCNNVDDDCSGQTDEDYTPVATSCGFGTCMASGVTSCVSGSVHDSCVVPSTDTDHDGTPDCSDGCPNDAPKTAAGVCGCATADTDSDGDGTPNCVDPCPADAQNDADGDGLCADADACPHDAQNDVDGDGVCGDIDDCPDVANPDQADSDQDGAGDACDYYPMTAVASGGSHSCGLLLSGEVVCWGDNPDGQLGNGSNEASMSAVAVTGLNDAQEVVAGHAHSCARRASGQVVCWGANSKGQLGNGTTSSASTPVPVSNLTDATQLAAGLEHTCALRSTGAVVCWGSNKADAQAGQLGNGANPPPASCGKTTCNPSQSCDRSQPSAPVCKGPVLSEVPVAVTGLVDAVQVTAGFAHSCALRSTGEVVCWGANWYGQIGNGVADPHGPSEGTRAPVAVTGLSDAIHLDAGDLHNCAVRATGGVVCWGANWYGQLGNASTSDASSPVAVAGLSDAVMVAAGQHHSCALRQSGAVSCWGYNPYGQLGDGTLLDANVPHAVASLSDATQVSAGDLHSCALRVGGEVQCWGDAEYGQLGHSGGARAMVPTAVKGLVDAVKVAAGSYHACALRSGGTVSCWGANTSGALGTGQSYDATTPQSVTGLADITDVRAGDDFACAIASDGKVHCWGYGDDGQLGNSDTSSSASPVVVSGISTGVAIATGVAHACAAISGGTVKCWGDGSAGQLGAGDKSSSPSPVTVAGLSGATSVAAGNAHSCALLSSGGVMCWGANNRGQLGTGTNTPSLTPALALGVTSAISLTAGDSSTCALRSNGQVMCWGGGASTPYVVSGVSDAVAIAAGSDHTCAVRSNGELSCWGKNGEGQLGDGSTDQSGTPVAVAGFTGGVHAGAGLYFTCAVRSFGTVYCWGAGDSGQLGNGYPWSNLPMRVVWPVLP